MKINITNYSCCDEGIVSKTGNISSIIDKLIRLAAKLTERFASDIVYDIAGLESAMQTKTPLDHLLFFRECGVETRKTEKFDVRQYDSLFSNFQIIQVWRLTHDPVTMETKLIRVDVHKTFL